MQAIFCLLYTFIGRGSESFMVTDLIHFSLTLVASKYSRHEWRKLLPRLVPYYLLRKNKNTCDGLESIISTKKLGECYTYLGMGMSVLWHLPFENVSSFYIRPFSHLCKSDGLCNFRQLFYGLVFGQHDWFKGALPRQFCLILVERAQIFIAFL